MLNDFGVTIPKEETDKVDTLRYSFHKLMRISVSIQYGAIVIWYEGKQEYRECLRN